VTGRIIDADVDAIANIDRLTAQVETLKWERDMAVEGQRIAREQVQRLQESLTACEQERDDFKRIVEVWRKRHGGAEDRVRVLEGAKGYELDNCRWATATEQANNRRTNLFIEIDGQRHTLAEWSRSSGMDPRTLRRRIADGMDPKEALTKPLRNTRRSA
jgi:CRISPR/Cas system-associated endoribonuclease Cas2